MDNYIEEGDIVTIIVEGIEQGYGFVEEIKNNVKPDWYDVSIVLISKVKKVLVWTINETYLKENEFRINGATVRLVIFIKGKKTYNNINNKKELKRKQTANPDYTLEGIGYCSKCKNIRKFKKYKKWTCVNCESTYDSLRNIPK